MRQEPDKIKQNNDKPDREAHFLMNAGSEPDFAYILNTVGQGVLVTGKGWRFEYVNPAFARLVGKPIEDLIGKSMDDIVTPEDLPTLAQMRSKRLAGETNSYDLRLRRSDGEVVYVHATGAPRRLGDKVIGSISIITDLTEQKMIETTLKTERDKAEKYLNIAEVILVALDTNARITLLNRKGYQILGYEEGELIGKNWIKTCLSPEDHERVLTTNDKIVAGEMEPFEYYENYVLTKKREERFIVWHTTVLEDDKGRIIGTLSSGEDITDRRQAENQLDAERSRLKAIIDNAPLGIIVADKDAKILLVNQAAKETCARDIPIGKTIERPERFSHLDGTPYNSRDLPLTKSALTGEVCVNEELIFTLPDGQKCHHLGNSAPIIDGRGEIIGAVGIFNDITDRRRAEEALKESEEKYRNLVERANAGITIIQDGTVRYANPALTRLWGESVEEVVGRPFTDFIYPDKIPEVVERYRRRMANESVTPTYETILRRRNGTKIFVELNAGLITFQGTPADLVIVQDITERKLAEKALQESEERFRRLAENAPDVVFRIEILPEPNLSYISPAVTRYVDYTPEDFYANPELGFKLVHPDDLPQLNSLINGEIPSDTFFTVRWLSKNGTYIWAEHLSMPVYDDFGILVAVESIARDITERKQAEEALRKAHDELEMRVKERTEELTKKNTEMERFIYTVSHDLRTPLISMSGLLGFLKQDAEKGDLERMNVDLRIANEAVTKMDRLLLETLELSRIGRVVNPLENVSFGEIVEDALRLTGNKIKSKEVKVSVAQDLPVVHVDKMRISEVLVNLIENCAKYMGDQTRPCIEIGSRLEEDQTVFFVRDNGIGIDPSQHNKVFGLFYKVEKKSEGTGAGLTIVKRIIEVHGGRIWIESELRQGCTICFTLPIANVG
jgi:PAS domain S-box-containing protein